MEYLNQEQIFELCKDIDNPLTFKREVNKIFRQQDESHLWPICGRYNVTDKAIRKAQWFQRESGCALEGLEYIYFVYEEIGRIVNSDY